MSELKLYEVSEEYVSYISTPLSSPKNSDYQLENGVQIIRKALCSLRTMLIYNSRLLGFKRKSMIPITTIPSSFRHNLILSLTTMIFLKESPICTNDFFS